MKILLIDQNERPHEATDNAFASSDWEISRTVHSGETVNRILSDKWDGVVLRYEPDAEMHLDSFSKVRQALETGAIPSVFVVPDPMRFVHRTPNALVEFMPPPASDEAIACRMTYLFRYRELLSRMEAELDKMQRLGKRLNQHFSEVDQEMQLASRLQRDFLPKIAEPIRGVKFECLYRPASWVSGDIYDIIRVDEDHVACYIADAVGHGMAASLLTMFIKQAVKAKLIEGDDYRVLRPDEALGQLNDSIAAHTLPNCQFVTAIYMLINLKTLVLEFARGGHPYPLLIRKSGQVTELQSQGGLLGIFQGESFLTERVQLMPGDKVILYTDGMELAFQEDDPNTRIDTQAYFKYFRRFSDYPLRKLIDEMNALLDADAGSLHPRDDVSMIGFEIPANHLFDG